MDRDAGHGRHHRAPRVDPAVHLQRRVGRVVGLRRHPERRHVDLGATVHAVDQRTVAQGVGAGVPVRGVSKRVSSGAFGATFTVSWTPPATPTLTVTAGSPVQVVVSGVTVGNIVQIEQALDGVTWTPLTSRTATATTMTVTSVLAANGTAVKIRARQGSIVEGVPMTSAWSTQQTVTATPDGCWLVDDTDRATALKISPVTDTPRHRARHHRHLRAGRDPSPRGLDPQAGERGELVLATDTLVERAALLSWLRTGPSGGS